MAKLISVKERLPEKDKEVLTYSKAGIPWCVAEYSSKYDCWMSVYPFASQFMMFEVRYWAELPKPPENE